MIFLGTLYLLLGVALPFVSLERRSAKRRISDLVLEVLCWPLFVGETSANAKNKVDARATDIPDGWDELLLEIEAEVVGTPFERWLPTLQRLPHKIRLTETQVSEVDRNIARVRGWHSKLDETLHKTALEPLIRRLEKTRQESIDSLSQLQLSLIRLRAQIAVAQIEGESFLFEDCAAEVFSQVAAFDETLGIEVPSKEKLGIEMPSKEKLGIEIEGAIPGMHA